jgi:hypothetical protein
MQEQVLNLPYKWKTLHFLVSGSSEEIIRSGSETIKIKGV